MWPIRLSDASLGVSREFRRGFRRISSPPESAANLCSNLLRRMGVTGHLHPVGSREVEGIFALTGNYLMDLTLLCSGGPLLPLGPIPPGWGNPPVGSRCAGGFQALGTPGPEVDGSGLRGV
jgi:hypothetical protein